MIWKFLTALLLYAAVHYIWVGWANAATSYKPLKAGLFVALVELLGIAGLWLVFVEKSIPAMAGLVLGGGLGAYLGTRNTITKK